ncbi:MAG: GNAT family protein [Hyphomonadaceae bacterium]
MQLNAPNFENPWLTACSVGSAELPFDEAFMDLLRDAGAEDAMWKWLPRISAGGTSFESYCKRVKVLTEDKKIFPMVCRRKSDDGFVGGATFVNHSRTHRMVQIGLVWLTKERRDWIHFLALQELMIRRAFDWGAKRVVWHVVPQNEKMALAVEQMGVTNEGLLRSVYRMNDGSWSDMSVYSLVQDEIPQALERLCETLEDNF